MKVEINCWQAASWALCPQQWRFHAGWRPLPATRGQKGKNTNNSLVILGAPKKRILMAMLGDQIFGPSRFSGTAWPYLKSFWPHWTTLVQRCGFPAQPSKFCEQIFFGTLCICTMSYAKKGEHCKNHIWCFRTVENLRQKLNEIGVGWLGEWHMRAKEGGIWMGFIIWQVLITKL